MTDRNTIKGEELWFVNHLYRHHTESPEQYLV